MKVILLSELKGKGGEGDVVDVADGYANNYLFPQRIALPATKGNLKQLEQRKHNIAAREATRLENAQKTKEALENLTVRVEARVGEEGVLFGSVTAPLIAEALQVNHGIEIDRRRIDLKAPIKTAGEHEVVVSIYRDIKTPLKILVGDAASFAVLDGEMNADGEKSTVDGENLPENEENADLGIANSDPERNNEGAVFASGEETDSQSADETV